jgi:hypothetical protein
MENNNTLIDAPETSTDVPENGPGGPKKGDVDPVESSAFFIHQAHQQFKSLAYGLANRKKRAIARVLEAVLFEPLEKVELTGKDEQQLFEICQQVMYNKGIVLKYSFERASKKVKGELNEQEE